jgi:forkhead transcription factor HCM1
MARQQYLHSHDESLRIFQDQINTVTAGRPMTSHAPMPSLSKPPRRAFGNVNANANASANIVFNRPLHQSSYSPQKFKSSSPCSPLQPWQVSPMNAMPMAPPAGKGRSTDSLQKKPPLSNFKTVLQKPFQDPVTIYGKENVHPQISPAIGLVMENYSNPKQMAGAKRALMDAAPIKEARPAKKMRAEEPTLPPHDSFPPITDDGNKPPHSYAQMIGMAILRSPNRRLTLSQIYRWISDNYSFYKANDAGWQNSIRHNLSLHKNFIKIERPKDDPGKGNYWGIEPGTELQFLKEKPTRKSAPTAENLPVMSTRLEPSRPPPMTVPEPTLPPPGPMRQSALPPLPTSQATMTVLTEFSSDATIPVSDGAAPEDAADKQGEDALPADPSTYSPMPATMHSSPPMPRRQTQRSGTPPPQSFSTNSSASRSHKRKFASMDDSGYISSLESSVIRRNPRSMLLTSEGDPPQPHAGRIKRGRAEEEIVRLRNSSPHSPTKARSHSFYGPVSSSPLRPTRENQMLPPHTPIVKMKPVVRPPPSVSPNTTLRQHRAKVSHMLGSPLRRVASSNEDSVPWSPEFQLDDTLYNFPELGGPSEFTIFQDMSAADEDAFASIGSMEGGSPIKRSAKRARLERSITTPALGDITNSAAKKSVTSAPLLKASELTTEYFDTPSKVFEGLDSPYKFFQQSPIRGGGSPSKYSNLDDFSEQSWMNLAMNNDLMSNMGPETAAESSILADVNDFDILQGGFGKIGDRPQPPARGGSRNFSVSEDNFF